jgi:hypothetical protein
MKRVSKPSPVPPSAFDQAAPLSPFIIRQARGRKGLTVDSVIKGKGGMRWCAGAKGEPIDTPRMFELHSRR